MPCPICLHVVHRPQYLHGRTHHRRYICSSSSIANNVPDDLSEPVRLRIGYLQLREQPPSVEVRTSSHSTLSTIAADLGNTMLFPSLCAGGRLEVIASSQAGDSEARADHFVNSSPTCSRSCGRHFAALLRGGRGEALTPRQILVFGGDVTDLAVGGHVSGPGATLRDRQSLRPD